MAQLVSDSFGTVYRVEEDGSTRPIVDYFTGWTDIAVREDGVVFAVTFDGLYTLDLQTGSSTFLRSLGGSINALEVDRKGDLYVAGTSGNLIQKLDGRTFAVEETLSFGAGRSSSGDIAVDGSDLHIATNDRRIVTIDLKDGSIESSFFHGISAVYGLAMSGRTLNAYASDDLYAIDLNAGTVEYVSELLTLGNVYGADDLSGIFVGGTNADDVLVADAGGSPMDGRGGDDLLVGAGGQDTLAGGDGDDTVLGRGDRDRLDGGAGRDIVDGGGGKDRVAGGDGRDYLFGGAGNDRLDGGRGRDVIEGGAGRDRLEGGRGADIFVFAVGDDRDTIRDFETGKDELSIEADLAGGVTSVARVLNTYGREKKGDVVLDFGDGDRLTVKDVTIAELAADTILF